MDTGLAYWSQPVYNESPLEVNQGFAKGPTTPPRLVLLRIPAQIGRRTVAMPRRRGGEGTGAVLPVQLGERADVTDLSASCTGRTAEAARHERCRTVTMRVPLRLRATPTPARCRKCRSRVPTLSFAVSWCHRAVATAPFVTAAGLVSKDVWRGRRCTCRRGQARLLA